MHNPELSKNPVLVGFDDVAACQFSRGRDAASDCRTPPVFGGRRSCRCSRITMLAEQPLTHNMGNRLAAGQIGRTVSHTEYGAWAQYRWMPESAPGRPSCQPEIVWPNCSNKPERAKDCFRP
jgi:hypothetical protein